jgi:cytosine/adenosine deaminase-related metal-dependent hydrolase
MMKKSDNEVINRTLHPAQAVGLIEEYGSLEVGKIADVILVQLSRQGIPAIQRLFVEGEDRVKRDSFYNISDEKEFYRD